MLKTKVQKETVFPQWYETLAVDLELADPLDLAPSVSIMVYDKDQFSLGMFILSILPQLNLPYLQMICLG